MLEFFSFRQNFSILNRGVALEVLEALFITADDEDLTSTQLCRNIIVPLTERRSTSFVEMIRGRGLLNGNQAVSKANCFVSHAWFAVSDIG